MLSSHHVHLDAYFSTIPEYYRIRGLTVLLRNFVVHGHYFNMNILLGKRQKELDQGNTNTKSRKNSSHLSPGKSSMIYFVEFILVLISKASTKDFAHLLPG